MNNELIESSLNGKHLLCVSQVSAVGNNVALISQDG